MTTKLRLTPASEEQQATGTRPRRAGTVESRAERPLVFPAEAMRSITRRRSLVAGTVGTSDLIAEVERTLDSMQQKIDQLKTDAAECYKFPPPIDPNDRPFAA